MAEMNRKAVMAKMAKMAKVAEMAKEIYTICCAINQMIREKNTQSE